MRNLNILLAFLLLSAACKQQDNFDGETWTSIDNVIANAEFSNIRNMAETEIRSDTAIWKTGSTQGLFCPASTVTRNSSGNHTGTLTIDMGAGITCGDGRLRSGQIIVNYSGRWRDAGSTLTITGNNYTVNTWPVVFTMTITNNGSNGSGQAQWTSTVTNAHIGTAEGTIEWSGTRVTTWTQGASTLTDNSDDRFEITGSGSGKSRGNWPFTWTIVNPLLVSPVCAYLLDGSMDLTPQDRPTRTLTFSNGNPACDNTMMLRVGNYQTELIIP